MHVFKTASVWYVLPETLEMGVRSDVEQVFNTVAKQDSVASIELARAATRDSRSMKVIAFATVVFLPATFVSVCLWIGFGSDEITDSV